MASCVVAGTVRKSISGLDPLNTLESAVSPGVGVSGAKSGNSVRTEDHLKSAGDSKIDGSVSQASSVTSPLFGHLPTQHSPYQYRRRRWLHRSTPSPTEEGAAEVYSISGRGRRDGGLLHLWSREARWRSSSTPGLSSKFAAVVSNATSTSPCPLAHCSAVGRFSRSSL
jgi:hypothetical protein